MESTELLNTSPLGHIENETWKDFCGKTFHQMFPVTRVILHLGPRGCRGEHTLHYLDGWSLRNPSVFGLAKKHGSKNTTWATGVFFCHIRGTSRYVRCLWSHISMWKWRRDKEEMCAVGFLRKCPRFPHSTAVICLMNRKTIIRGRIVKVADAGRRDHLCHVSVIIRSPP